MKWIADQSALDEALGAIGDAPAFAIDTEADSLHSYFDKVCLIQISANGEDLLVDPLARIELAALGTLLADVTVRKVFHGADYDLRILNRDFGFEVRNLFDTMVASQLLGYEALGLAALLKRHFGLEVDKSHQRADWAQRPLPRALRDYAVNDTHYLLGLATILEGELRAAGRWEWASEEFERLEAIRFAPQETDPDAWRRVKGSNRLEARGLAVVERLHAFRDRIARELDRPPFKVLNNEAIVTLATQLPRSANELRAIKGMSGWIVRQWGPDILAVVEEVVSLSEEALPKKQPSKVWQRDKDLERRIERLKKVRDRVATDLKIDPAVLAPKHVLASVAALDPREVAALEGVPTLRRWQKSLLGEAFVEALGGTQNAERRT
ncbi:MAG: ribonuclease D [Thermoanaerobaculia bacterium]